MPGEPKKKHAKSRTRIRRASRKLALPTLVACPNCKEMILPHQACSFCGYYGGKTVSEHTQVKVTKV